MSGPQWQIKGFTMLWVFSAAGLTGIACGCLFRAPAIIILSFVTFGCVLVVSAIVGASVGGATVSAFLTSAALQLGYLLGIGVQHFWRHVQVRIMGLVMAAKTTTALVASPNPAFERPVKGRQFGI
jgi:hypothetical protein